MANFRLVTSVALLMIFLTLPPRSSGAGLDPIITSGNALFKIFRVCRRCFGTLGTMMDIYDILSKLGVLPDPQSKGSGTPTSNTQAEPVGLFINFSVGNPMQPVTAQMSISNALTLLTNYEPSYSSSRQCCTVKLNCSKENCNGDYNIQADTFTFESGNLSKIPYMYDRGNQIQKPTGFLSFSRNPNSLLRNSPDQALSYYFSDCDSSSYFILGGSPTATSLQSTKILSNPNYPDLYYVNLTQISIGNNSYKIDPATNSSSMILDTVVVPTLLESTVYAKVVKELKNIRVNGKYTDNDNKLEVCYTLELTLEDPVWPNITLYFPTNHSSSTDRAQMVLTKKNYVVKVNNNKVECAAIFETKGASVIGIMAQINRGMIIDLSKNDSRLYFSKYSSRGSSVIPSTITFLFWSMYVLLHLHVPV